MLEPRIADRVRAAVDAHVERGLGGVAWAVDLQGHTTDGAAGWLDPGSMTRPMTTDAIFRLSSVTKPIATVAALQIVDAGIVGLDDPVDEALPELADRRVLVDPTGALDGQTVPAQRPISLRDLLTFRCGIGMHFDFSTPQPVLDEMWARGVGPGPTGPECSPDEYMATIDSLPLSDQPGTVWRYHTGSDLLGVFVERVRGETLDRVLERDVLQPLGMTDTTFRVRTDQLDRFGDGRTPQDDGTFLTWDRPDGRWAAAPQFRSAAAGMLSTTADLVAFGRMLLAGGTAPDGRRVLSEELAAAMGTDQLTAEQRRAAQIDPDGTTGWGFGFGVQHVAGLDGWPHAGSYGWDGGLGCRFMIDPVAEVCVAILTTDAFGDAAPPVLDAVVRALAPDGA